MNKETKNQLIELKKRVALGVNALTDMIEMIHPDVGPQDSCFQFVV